MARAVTTGLPPSSTAPFGLSSSKAGSAEPFDELQATGGSSSRRYPDTRSMASRSCEVSSKSKHASS